MSIQITGLCKAFGPKAVLRGFTLCADGPLVLMGPPAAERRRCCAF